MANGGIHYGLVMGAAVLRPAISGKRLFRRKVDAAATLFIRTNIKHPGPAVKSSYNIRSNSRIFWSTMEHYYQQGGSNGYQGRTPT
jgi:hypothetical protein